MKTFLIVLSVASLSLSLVIGGALISNSRNTKASSAELKRVNTLVVQIKSELEAVKALQPKVDGLERQISELSQSLAIANEKLSAYQQAIAERAEAERLKPIAAIRPTITQKPTAQPERFKITDMQVHGGTTKCITDKGEMLIQGLPASISQYFADSVSLQKEIDDFSVQISRDDAAARRLDAVALTGAGGDQAYVNAAMAERRRANLAMEEVAQSKQRLAQKIAQLAKMKREARTAITATKTQLSYAGLQLWQFVAMAN